MRSSFFIVLFVLPFCICGQGIHFEKNESWKQIKQKAKQENKFIFMDCSASWCLPCKKMEKEVFPLQNVGDFMNEHFVSVHVQLDTSKSDDENTKAWYSDAHILQQQYKLTSYPSYLFFTPDGNIVHRYGGALGDTSFLKVATQALTPEKQYYPLLTSYYKGKKDFANLHYLASISKQIGEDSLAVVLALEYLHNYLNKQSNKELLQKKNFDFIERFYTILSSNDQLFKLLMKQETQVDKLMYKKFSQSWIVEIITREEINPKLWPNKKPIEAAPDWNKLTKTIKEKFTTDYVDLAVLNAQLRWYQKKKDKQQQIKYTVKKFENYGLDTAGIGWALINNTAYDLFLNHCNNKDILNKMIHWMEIINKDHPDDYQSMDTYANLIYKVGRVEEAIVWEEKAKRLEEIAALKEKRNADASFAETLDKMKKGIPTWENN